KIIEKANKNSGRVCKPDSVAATSWSPLASEFSTARRDDHSSRSRIAPGLQQPTRGSQQLAPSSALHTGWASPPLLFGLAPRGVFRAPDVATRAVGSYPTFSPLPNAPTVRGEPQVLPAACRRSTSVTGGLFSVALSVAALQMCLRTPQMQPPGVTRRVALHPERLPIAASRLWSPDFPPVLPLA